MGYPLDARGGQPLPRSLSFLASPGELGALIAAHDWSTTALGPLEAWPQSLRTAVSLMLNSRHPMWIGWGPDASFLYNDAYIDVLSRAKHPWALGRPAREVWAEIWDFCGPLADAVFQRAEATFVDDVQLFMNRGDFVEETWYSFSYSPITDERGEVGGLFCPSTDATSSNLNARRLATLSSLSTAALCASAAQACATAAATLAGNPSDLPFALLYLAGEDRRSARLAGLAGLAPDAPAAVPELDLHDDAGAPFPVAQVCADGRPVVVSVAGLGGLPAGLANQPVQEAILLPLAMAGRSHPVGVLVAGISPVCRLDSAYRTFFDLIATQVATAIHNAIGAEEQRRKADMLAELDRAKTAFFSNVSHEFRTPLTLMLAPIEDALADAAAPLAPVQRERVKLMQRNALRLQKLVNTLLDFARVQSGRMHAAFAPVDLPALTADLASGFRSVVEGAGLTLEVRTAPLAAPAYVDVALWEKIVLNLVSNAFKFTFRGGIAVTLDEEGGAAVLRVADTGVGIPAEHLGRVFERFQRIEGARSRTHEGSGIGLALVRDLVELHGGAIGVDSAVGAGTTFTVRLPLGCAHLPPEQLAEPARSAPDARLLDTFTGEAQRWLPAPDQVLPLPDDVPARPTAGARILVADDNADMRDYLSRLLGQSWQVSGAANGEEALRLARAAPPDLVISDVMMPVLDGFGLIAALRADARTHDVPVILLSARAGEEARIEGLNAGADDYLVKPFGARELITRAEAQLMRARIHAVERGHAERLNTIFRHVPAAMAILRGPDYVFDLVNERYFELVGRRDFEGLPLREARPEIEAQGFIALLDEVRRTGRPHFGRSARVLLADPASGELRERFFDYVYQPMPGPDGAVESVAVMSFEVTALARAQRDAEVANRAKDEFLAMLGHELRNPLSPILIALELLRLKGISGAEKEHAIIERQAQHLVRLVDDLLDVARIAQGKVELRPERAELSRLVAQAVETVSPLLEERHHRLRLDVPNTGIFVHADPMRFTQVLSNLLTNAAKYTNPGGAIGVRVFQEAGAAVIQVEDNGIGIAPATLPHLFDKFVQERQALDRSRGGLGLGLAIVKSIVALHGGTVTAHSDGEGQGSRFEVRVPVSVEANDGPDPQRRSAAAPAGACCTVLLVDDNPDVLTALGELLRMSGHAVTALPDPAAALKLGPEYAPELAILDIGLPGMDGYDLALELARRPGFAETRFIALSGYGQEADRVRSRSAGFYAHLVKPVSGSQLAALMESLLRPA
ncbi:MAG: ATP-binding protein [Telluria sp.]